MPTRNSLSLISLGTPTSMGLPPTQLRTNFIEVIAGNSPSGHFPPRRRAPAARTGLRLWLFALGSVISGARLAAAAFLGAPATKPVAGEALRSAMISGGEKRMSP